MHRKFSRHFGNISAWLVIGMSGILVIVVLILAVMNYNREKGYMAQVLSEKGESLIRAFEAGARTGMMGQFGTFARLETLMKEMSKQEDIIYITIVDTSGKILAHNIPEKIGGIYPDAELVKGSATADEVKWRVKKKSTKDKAFEVYKIFLPLLPAPHQTRMMSKGHKMMQSTMGAWCMPGWMTGLQEGEILDPKDRPIIIIGMDTLNFEKAIQEDIKLTVVISGILLLLGLAGIVSLFWAQSYARSRQLLSNVRAFSAEMIANLPEGIILTDKDFNIRYINQIASQLIDVNIDRSIGLAAEAVLPEDIFTFSTSATKSGAVETEIEITQKDNKITPVSIIATKVITDDGVFVGLMYILKDLTLLKQLQLEVQRKEKLAVIGNLAAGIAHEVRNPLSSIKGYATHFKRIFADDDENRAAAEILIAETDRLNRVITELLEISRPSDINPKKSDLRSLLETTIRLIQPDSETGPKINITSNIDDTINHLFIDPDRFVQVLMNIYLNGIQAMPNGGELHTQVDRTNGGVVMVISDTGEGLSNETRRKVFDPYFTTKKTGTGLGLAIVQRIIEAHEGTIMVDSEKGKGTSVTITLPNTI